MVDLDRQGHDLVIFRRLCGVGEPISGEKTISNLPLIIRAVEDWAQTPARFVAQFNCQVSDMDCPGDPEPREEIYDMSEGCELFPHYG